MLPTFEAFLDATPEKGVIIVEYYWQRPAARARPGSQRENLPNGIKTSMAFFKRLRAADKCWCGSKRQFSHCHRRADDWTYVTLDPDQRAFSPVALFHCTYLYRGEGETRSVMEGLQGLLPIACAGPQVTWAVPAQPLIENEAGRLILGTVAVNSSELVLETNSEKRLDTLERWLIERTGGALSRGPTRRTEPQQALPAPRRRR